MLYQCLIWCGDILQQLYVLNIDFILSSFILFPLRLINNASVSIIFSILLLISSQCFILSIVSSNMYFLYNKKAYGILFPNAFYNLKYQCYLFISVMVPTRQNIDVIIIYFINQPVFIIDAPTPKSS